MENIHGQQTIAKEGACFFLGALMRGYGRRLGKLLLGLLLMATGSFLIVQANIGLSPWTAFGMGFVHLTGASLGSMMIATSVMIVLVDIAFREKIGLGTLLNCVMIGTVMDCIARTGLIPLMHNFWLGIPVLFSGLLLMCLGTYFYISTGLGCGPRDALMVALCKRFPRTPVGVIRSSLEGSALFVGWLLGAKVGVGTIIAVFGIGIMIQATFKILRFDVKSVRHESILETLQSFRRTS